MRGPVADGRARAVGPVPWRTFRRVGLGRAWAVGLLLLMGCVGCTGVSIHGEGRWRAFDDDQEAMAWAGFHPTPGVELLDLESVGALDTSISFVVRGTPRQIDAFLRRSHFTATETPGLQPSERTVLAAFSSASPTGVRSGEDVWLNAEGQHVYRFIARGRAGAVAYVQVWAYDV